MSLALARKYRPATFDDLIGQESVSQTLSLALDNDRLSHAYLFSGLRGSGKTSTARIFAKALLCEKGTSSHPCGECTHCIMAAENRHMDIIEMDAASNRGIDDIKELIEHTKYKPSSARYKIFIIDEVHMLTTQAFNALLKTLEEPPSFVKFILATTDPLKLPATILSRTQHFRFKKIPHNLVVTHLEHILNLEGIGYEKEALEIIARSGAGSLRDSLTLLDQAIVYSKNHVDVTTVTGMLGIIEPSLLDKLLQDILRKDTAAILNFVKLAADYEVEMILDELTLHLKALLLSQDSTYSPMIIERFFRIIADAKSILALGSDGEFVLSLTLFKMVEALEIREIDTMIKALQKELQGVEKEKAPAVEHPSSESPKVVTITQEEIIATLPKAVEKESKPESDTPKAPPAAATTPEAHPTEEKLTTVPAETEEPEKSEAESPSPAPQQTTQAVPPTEERSPKASTAPTFESPQPTPDTAKFTALVSKIYDRDYDLGNCFERNISFVNFADNLLTWESTAEESDKQLLITHWGIINMFVKEIFGFETKIKNIAKKKAVDSREQVLESREQGIGKREQEVENREQGQESREQVLGSREQHTAESVQQYHTTNQTANEEQIKSPESGVIHDDADSGSMIEEIEMKSSCIAPDAGETEAAKEKDPSVLLEEPMVKTALDLFNPKKVRIKRNA